MKNFVKIAFVAVFAAAAGYGVYTSQKSELMSDLALANVEALAGGEDSSAGDPCYKGAYNSNLPEAVKCAQPCTKERCGGLTDKCY